jgi:hypothetical protein
MTTISDNHNENKTSDKPTILDKYMVNQTKCFKSYMKLKGFPGIAREFKSGHEIKFNEASINNSCEVVGKDKIEKLLIKLGEFRIFTIENLFNLALEKVSSDNPNIENIEKKHFFVAAGSTNVTSDYDVTISGPYCSQIIKHMFEIYRKQFDTVLPIGFDTNLYPGTAGYTTIDGLHQDFSDSAPDGFLHITLDIGNYKDKTVLLPIKTKGKEGTDENASTIQNYQWVCSKLHDGLSQLYDDNEYNVLVDKFNVFKSFLEDGKKISELCKKKFCEKQETKETDELTIEANTLTKSYTDMWTHCEKLDEYYRNGLNNELPHEMMEDLDNFNEYINTPLGYSCLVNWLCSEAYYSSFTVYAIVVCLQLKYSGEGFINDIWLVAIIENLADLIKHMLRTISHSEEKSDEVSEDEYKKMYITYSKYYYRIYFCLKNYYSMVGDDENKNNADARFEKLEQALQRRKDFDIVQADADNIWGKDCLDIDNINEPKNWLKKTATNLITTLNSVIQINKTGRGGKRKKKTRKRKRSKKKKTFKKTKRKRRM